MSTGFKTATVASADVPATQTNFPVYIDLSRLGITTQADADSVRVYADSGKTTEWAREIVSATEMHVKVPSLTSTTAIYVYWDGTSADYAVTDTYGRNAVWSGYRAVWHLKEASGTRVDSSGNSCDLTDNNTVTSTTGKLTGDAALFTKANSEYLSKTDTTQLEFDGTDTYTMTVWTKLTSNFADNAVIAGKYHPTSGQEYINMINPGAVTSYMSAWHSSTGSSSNVRTTGITTSSVFSTATWYHLGMVIDAANGEYSFYRDASVAGSVSDTNYSLYAGTRPFEVGRRNDGVWYYDGALQELRLTQTLLSANWITTEYNNQSDEAGFWGTWSDVGGATNTTNFFLMM